MPNNQRRADATKASYTLGDTKFKGMDTFTDPNHLDPGMAQEITNLVSDGRGSLVLRNGWQGQFTTALASAIYEPTAYRMADGSTTRIVFASGGKLYKCDAGATTYTELLKDDNTSFSFPNNGLGVRMVQYGKYLYGVPGAGSGAIFRTDTTGGAGGGTSELVALSSADNSGAYKPPASRRWYNFIAGGASYTLWSDASPSLSSTSNLLDGGSFETSGHAYYTNNYVVGSNGSDRWEQASVVSGSARVRTLASIASGFGTGAIKSYDGVASGQVVLLDEAPYDGIYQDITSLPSETLNSVSTTVGLYELSVRLFNNGVANGYKYSVDVTVQAMDVSSGVLASVTETLALPYAQTASDWVTYKAVCDFRQYKVDLNKMRVTIQLSAGAPTGSTDRAILVDGVNMYAISDALVVETQVGLGEDQLIQISVDSLSPNTFDYAGYVAGKFIKSTVSAVNVSSLDSLSLIMRFPDSIAEAPPDIRLGLQEGSSTIYWTNYGTLSDGSMTFDISTINRVYRDAVTSFYVEFSSDVPMLSDGEPIVYVGAIADPGFLTPDATYEYMWTEWKPSAAGYTPKQAGQESPPTRIGSSATTTDGYRVVYTAMNPTGNTPPVNTGATYIKVYRRCASVFTDGLFRLVASFTIANALTSSYTDPENGYWVVGKPATEVTINDQFAFYDNTPDSAIANDVGEGYIGEIYRQGRDYFPTGANAIAVYQRRLWVGKGNTLYASWLLNASNEYAIYTTYAPDPADPLLPIKGASFTISSPSDNEPIVALLPYGGDSMQRDSATSAALIAFRENSLHVVNGSDAGNFAAQQFLRQAGQGLLAPRACTLVDNHPWFLSASGVLEFKGQSAAPRSLELEKVLNPSREAGGSYITAAAYKLCAMVWHNRRLFLFAPVAGGSANTVAYVWDSRVGGWFKFTTPGFTSACSLSGGGDTQDFYLAGADGQLYRHNGYTDIGYSGGAPIGISYIMNSRRHGQSAGEGIAYYAKNRPYQLDVHMEPDVSHTFTWRVTSNAGATRTGTWNIGAGAEKAVAIRSIPHDLGGITHEVKLTGSASSAVKLYAYLLHCTESAITRTR